MRVRARAFRTFECDVLLSAPISMLFFWEINYLNLLLFYAAVETSAFGQNAIMHVSHQMRMDCMFETARRVENEVFTQ